MINGAHLIIYSQDPDADRAFVKDLLGWPHVDAGAGWLIFRLPPAEIAIHPVDGPPSQELYLLCDNLNVTISELAGEGVEFAEVVEARWGMLTRLRLPSGAELGLYEPRHPRATGS